VPVKQLKHWCWVHDVEIR